MLIVTVSFTVAITIGIIISLFFYKGSHLEKNKGKKKQWGRLFSDLVLKVIKPYFAYYVPFFHPWDDDNSHFVEQWKAEYEVTPPSNNKSTLS
jgi:predicted metal-dependent hydrolase